MRRSGLLGGLVFFALSVSSFSATVCSEAELRSALVAGGAITFDCDAEIVLSAPLQVTSDTVLDASGRDVTISGGGVVRVFEVANGISFTLKSVRVVNGYVKGADEVSTPTVIPAADAFAAGLAATNAVLILQDCTFSNNVALGGNAPLKIHANRAGEAYGGAVYASGGVLEVINSVFLTNSAFGGLISPSSTIPVNSGPGRDGDAWGGAIWVSGAPLKISGSIFSENVSINGGGAIYTRSNEVTITTSTFNTNWVSARTSGRNVGNLESDGFGGAVELRSVISAVITNSVFMGNFVTGGGGYSGTSKTLGGGALYSDRYLTIRDSEFVENFVRGVQQPHPIAISRGGAVCVEGNVLITGARFVGNSVVGPPSVTSTIGGLQGGSGFGGALFVSGESLVSQSAFVSNRAEGGYHAAGLNPGVAEGSAIYSTDNILATNLTVAWNLSQHLRENTHGAAVFCASSGASVTNTFQFCTFATNQYIRGPFNTASQILHARAGTNATINFRGAILSGGATNTLAGDFVDGGYNITSDSLFAHTTSKNNTDPKFGPFGLYGGRTETFPVLASGPAVNAVTADFPALDQRGRARPHATGADIGSYEVSPPYAAMGRVRREIDYDQIQLSIDGGDFGVSSNGTFLVNFTNAGSLSPSLSRVIFHPENIPLEPGVERFDLTFTGYLLNEVAIDNQGTAATISFAAESAGNYELQSSANLRDWNPLETISLSANSLYRKEVTASGSPKFYRVQKK